MCCPGAAHDYNDTRVYTGTYGFDSYLTIGRSFSFDIDCDGNCNVTNVRYELEEGGKSLSSLCTKP